jgi:hypothetical protein
LAFSPTGSFTTWSVSSANANLIDGTNKIRLTSIGFNGPNIDHLTFSIVKCQSGTLEAESAVLNGAVVASNQSGYTGSGFADYKNASGDFIEWTVNASGTKLFLLQFRYANGGTTDRPLKLEVNGKVVVGSLSFLPTGLFANWSISSVVAVLTVGVNKVRLTTIGFNGPNIDHMAFRNNSPLEAEEATLSGAVTASNYKGFTGFGFVDYKNTSDDFIEWSITTEAGLYSLQFRYANSGSVNRPLRLEVNGVVVIDSLTFLPTGSFDTWAVSSAVANLTAGINKVKLTAMGSSGPNIDHLALKYKNSLLTQKNAAAENRMTTLSSFLNLSVMPNPVGDILNIHAIGLQKNKRSTILVISSSGVVIKTKHVNDLTQPIQLNVESLASGVYIIKIVGDDKILYKQFVKL